MPFFETTPNLQRSRLRKHSMATFVDVQVIDRFLMLPRALAPRKLVESLLLTVDLAAAWIMEIRVWHQMDLCTTRRTTPRLA